jgi:hypothetical protein
MTTPQTPEPTRETSLAAEKMEADVREAEARLKVLKSQAEERKAQSDMDEISGLTAAKERVQKEIADMKQRAASDHSTRKHAVEQHIKELQVNIQRVHDRYTAWDDARERRFYARLDEADAQLKVWRAQDDKARAEHGAKARDELVKLEEKINQARARAKEARENDTAKAQAALEDAERSLAEAYDTAAKRFGKSGSTPRS